MNININIYIYIYILENHRANCTIEKPFMHCQPEETKPFWECQSRLEHPVASNMIGLLASASRAIAEHPPRDFQVNL